MTRTQPTIAIVGAGMGGLTVTATLRRAGFPVQVYEQARRFARIGAGIQMMPNSMKVLRVIGVEARVRGGSFEPYSHLNRVWDMEDAAVLARCLEAVDGEDIEGAFRRYEAHRKPRTSKVQAISSANTWMKGGNEDTSWLYGYDAWNVPLTEDPVTTAPDGTSR